MNKIQIRKMHEETRKAISLVDVIKSYGYDLRRESDEHMIMHCPFHNERTPSFKIYLQNNSFYCFGCGAGGSVIEFIARQESRTIESVIEQFSKTIDVTSSKFAIEMISKNLSKPPVDGNIYRQDMHFELRVWLREWLKKHPGKDVVVDDCFREMRMFFYDTENIDDKMIKKFSDYIIQRVKV